MYNIYPLNVDSTPELPNPEDHVIAQEPTVAESYQKGTVITGFAGLSLQNFTPKKTDYEIRPDLAENCSYTPEKNTYDYDHDADRLPHKYPGKSEYEQRIEQDMARGILPHIDNGFRFVIDRRPDEVVALEKPDPFDFERYNAFRNAQQIPDQQYTRYFKARTIPVADADHYMRSHDVGHVASYIKMFADGAFADLVVVAATNAADATESSKAFAVAMNGFGDSMRNLSQGGHASDVLGARNSLSGLIHIACPNPQNDPGIQANCGILFGQLWRSLGLASYEEQARTVRKAKNNIFEKMVLQPAA